MTRDPLVPDVHPDATLLVGPARYTVAELRERPRAVDELSRPALDFCRAWLRGDERFTLTTSGSTGPPKPIELTRAQMAASARATAAALGLRAGDRSLICLPTRFIAGRMMLVRGLVLGFESRLVEPSADPLASLPEAERFAFAAFVPLQMQTMLEGPPDRRARLDAMRAILVGGAPLSPALEGAIATLTAPVFHTYGMTESATHIALRPLTGARRSDRFLPLPGVETRLDDRGCLALRGPMTANAWLQTNDLVDLAGDGSFRWLGRVDLVVNSGGVKVAVEALEERLHGLLAEAGEAATGTEWGARRFFLAGVPDERLGQALTLIVEGEPLPVAEQEALKAFLRVRLEPWETPRQLLFTARLAETPNGKIDRPTSLAQALADDSS
jgi:O-succinylbenzoic acid--CoA ligase